MTERQVAGPTPDQGGTAAATTAAGSDAVVIVGAGVAGATAALTLRAEGHTGPVVLIGAEPGHPYRRPPLSKEVLLGRQPPERTLLRPVTSWQEQGVELLTGREVTGLEPDGRTLTLADGTVVPYDRLLLATGSRPRRPEFVRRAAHVRGVHELRTVEDARRLRQALLRGGHLLVVGAGLIGLEVAAAARTLGLDVTVLEAAPAALARTLPSAVAEAVVALHARHGVVIRTGVGVVMLDQSADGDRVSVLDTDGDEHLADTVLLAVGAEPASGLAERAGLAVDGGVLVDAFGASSAPGVWAAGEVARRPDPFLRRGHRVEHWTDSQDHGAAVARNLLGAATPFTALPWAWTTQYDATLQLCGYPDAADTTTVEGDFDALDFTARLTRDGRLVGAICAGRPAEFRRLRSEVTESTALGAVALSRSFRRG